MTLKVSLLMPVLILPVIAQAGPITPIVGGGNPMEMYESRFKQEAFDKLIKTDFFVANKLVTVLDDNGQSKNSNELVHFALNIRKFVIKGDSVETIEEYIKKTLPLIIQTASDSSSQDSIKDMVYHGLVAKHLVDTQSNMLVRIGGTNYTKETHLRIVSLISEIAETVIDNNKSSCEKSFAG